MTVREAFGKAFGDVPEDYPCYAQFGNLANNYNGACITQIHETGDVVMVPVWTGKDNYYEWKYQYGVYPKSPDISDRPAESFRGFFGKEYDDVIDAQKEEA